MTGSGSEHEQMPKGRAWLGEDAQGAERLAGLFGVGRAESVAGLDRTDVAGTKASELPMVELRRSPEPGERDYELHRCQGFDVYSGEERLGVVEGVVYGSRPDRPDVLEVRRGRFGRPLLVPVEDVEAIEPDEAAVVVRAGRASASRRRLSAAVARLRSPLAHG